MSRGNDSSSHIGLLACLLVSPLNPGSPGPLTLPGVKDKAILPPVEHFERGLFLSYASGGGGGGRGGWTLQSIPASLGLHEGGGGGGLLHVHLPQAHSDPHT